jgi:hypothetical protein
MCSLVFQPVVSLGHDHYQGLTRISYNQKSQKLEIIHRFTTHDLETIISKINGVDVSYKKKKFPKLVKQYFNKKFSIWKDNTPIKLTMIGAEPGEKTTVVYQIVEGVKQVTGLTIYNNLFIEYFPKQINLLNYQDATTQGTMIFSHGDIRSTIK